MLNNKFYWAILHKYITSAPDKETLYKTRELARIEKEKQGLSNDYSVVKIYLSIIWK